MANTIAQEIFKHPQVVNLLEDAQVEKSIYWIDEDTGLLCKTRPDIWSLIDGVGLVFDLKTTNDASQEKFTRSIRDGDYHIQMAMQKDGLMYHGHDIRYFGFVVSETKKPHYPFIYQATTEMIEQGQREYKEALKYMKFCIENNCWSLERDVPIRLNFSEYQQSHNPFQKLEETYNV